MYLITGASGFIGKKIVNALVQEDIPIIIVSREKMPGFKTIICDLEFETVPNNIFHNVNTVIHLAGFAHDVKSNHAKAHLHNSINFEATVGLANQASKLGVKKFVFISSVKASGAPYPERCMTEKDQCDPRDVYGKSKHKAELELLKIDSNSNMGVSILRPALVYGPNLKGNLFLMMSSIQKGFFPPLPKVNNRRSMVHVDDLIRAILLISREDRANGEIYNVTDGIPYSSRDIYEAMCRISGKPIPGWSVPLIFFKILSITTFGRVDKIDKLFESECYSSEKIFSLGFKPQKSIGEMNETIF
jgi:UDP-glucose 4-epimerase